MNRHCLIAGNYFKMFILKSFKLTLQGQFESVNEYYLLDMIIA